MFWKSATEAEIEEHGCRDDRHDMVGFGADWIAAVALGQPPRHPVGGGEAVGAAPGEADGVDAIDEVDRVQRLGLPGARSPAADVDAADRPRWWEHDRGAGQPAAPAPLVVADMDAGDVGEVVVRAGQRARREAHRRVPPPRKRRAASTYTLACSTMSATSTNSSAWWAIHLPPGPYTTVGTPASAVSIVPSVVPGTPPSRGGVAATAAWASHTARTSGSSGANSTAGRLSMTVTAAVTPEAAAASVTTSVDLGDQLVVVDGGHRSHVDPQRGSRRQHVHLRRFACPQHGRGDPRLAEVLVHAVGVVEAALQRR